VTEPSPLPATEPDVLTDPVAPGDAADPVPGDEVDRIVAAWRHEVPGVDVGPLEVLSRVTRLAHHLDRHRAAAFAGPGVEPWEFDVLAALRRSGAPYELSAGRLTTETLVTSGTMTNRVDRLAARGLVVRRPDPDDGRGVLVGLTDAGRTVVEAALAALVERERALLADLSPTDRAALAALLRRLVAPFDTRS
jgi:DNA-binding MarR family transcriptional regulator